MTDEKRKDEAPESKENPSEETRAKGLSRRDLLIGAGIAASGLLVAGGTHFLNNLPDDAIKGLIERGIGTDRTGNYFTEDALHVITTGTGAPLPDPKRVGPQAVVVAGDQMLVFDTGPGSTRNLALTGLNISSVNALFLTHYHSDHISDLGEFMLQHWTGTGTTEPLKYSDHQAWKKLWRILVLSARSRLSSPGGDVMPPRFGGVAHTSRELSSDVVYEAGDVQVIAFNVDHPPVVPAVGFRVNYKDRSVMITGDTIYSDSLIQHAKGADLMVSDSLNHKMSQWIADAGQDMDNNLSAVSEDIQESHIRPEEAARVAKEAGVPVLIITHVLPPVPDQLINPFLRDARAIYSGELRMANDGTLISLPVNSDRYSIHELLG